MKVLPPLLLFLLLSVAGFAGQRLPDSLGLKQQNGKTFIMHRVDRGGTLFSIGQRYDVSVDKLKATNPQTAENLVVGEVILVPYEGDAKPAESTTTWKRHTVKKGQTLYSVSQKYKATVEQIKTWNNLSGTNIQVGNQLKVGKAAHTNPQPEGDGRTEPEGPNTSTQAQSGSAKPSTEKTKADSNQRFNTKAIPKGDGLIAKQEKGKATWLENSNINGQKSLALHRTAPAGTIIKVKNLMNDKVVFVRTVGQLNRQKYNNTLITISKQAAEELEVENDFFRAKLEYTVKEPNN